MMTGGGQPLPALSADISGAFKMRLALVLSLLLAGLASTAPALAQGNCAATLATGTEAEVLAAVNRLRAGAGIRALQANRHLALVAQAHACDNAARSSYSHTGSDGSDLARRLRRGQYDYRDAAENTGLGHATVQAMVDFWARSPGHRANLLNPALTEAGLGLSRTAKGRNVWVLVQGRR